MYSPRDGDHFYTTSAAERDNAVQNLGYNNEGVTGYVYPQSSDDTVPFYRAYNGKIKDHFYTVNAVEMDNAVRRLGYSFEGIAAYVI